MVWKYCIMQDFNGKFDRQLCIMIPKNIFLEFFNIGQVLGQNYFCGAQNYYQQQHMPPLFTKHQQRPQHVAANSHLRPTITNDRISGNMWVRIIFAVRKIIISSNTCCHYSPNISSNSNMWLLIVICARLLPTIGLATTCRR